MKSAKINIAIVFMFIWLSIQPTPIANSQQISNTDSIARVHLVDSLNRKDEKIIITRIQIRVLKEELKNLKKTLKEIKKNK